MRRFLSCAHPFFPEARVESLFLLRRVKSCQQQRMAYADLVFGKGFNQSRIPLKVRLAAPPVPRHRRGRQPTGTVEASAILGGTVASRSGDNPEVLVGKRPHKQRRQNAPAANHLGNRDQITACSTSRSN